MPACPFCNSVLPPLASPTRSEKLPCPRCGEPVPAANFPVDPSRTPPASNNPVLPSNQAPGKRTTLVAILGVMLVMAVIALSYALWTQAYRRSNDRRQQATVAPVSLRRPLELSGLGYLPPGCHVVVGLQVAELLQDSTGRQLLEAPRPAAFDWVFKQLSRTAGMKLEDLDHVLAATSFDALFPQLVLVVKTRSKVSLEKIAESQPNQVSSYQDRPLYEFSLKPFSEALVWCVDDHTLLYVIRAETPRIEHLKGLSAKERPVREVLSAPLYQALEDRLGQHQLLWAVGRLDQLGPLKDFLPLVRADVRPLLDVKRFALGVTSVEGLTMTAQFELPDAKKVDRLKTFLEAIKIDGATSQKVVTPPEGDPDPWITWQVRGNARALRTLLVDGVQGKK